MNGFVGNIEELARANHNFRQVLYTAKHSQLVLMTLQPGEEIGEETHDDNDQFLRIEAGQGEVIIDGHHHPLIDGSAVVVPAGTRHNVINLSKTEPLKLYTLYSPPHHRDGVLHANKAKALSDDEEFDGQTTE